MFFRRLAIILLCIQTVKLAGQSSKIAITGRVKCEINPKDKMVCVFVKLSFNGEDYMEVECDTLGGYLMEVPPNMFEKYKTGKLTVNQSWDCIRNKYPQDRDCPYLSFRPPMFMSTRSENLITPLETNTNYIANFKVAPVCVLPRTPVFGFKKNSTELTRISGFDPDSTFNCLLGVVKSNPNTIFKITAYTYHEKRPRHLAKNRLAVLRNKFISNGIDAERIVTVIGEATPLNEYEIKKAKTKEERQALEAENRRATLSIVSFDYDPKLKKEVIQKPKAVDEEGDD
ncbi:MAG: hypothetical protein IT236_01345 [Bacteroidia bacterium]|nr:hypothetical protein [Bacteroidia bacterium]